MPNDTMTRTERYLAHFTKGYALAMLRYNTYVIGVDDLADSQPVEPAWWQSGDPFWPIHAWEEDSQHLLEQDCADFFMANQRYLLAYMKLMVDFGLEALADQFPNELSLQLGAMECAGQDFALTRNGHGAGFWSRPITDVLGAALTAAAKTYGGSQGWLSGDENEPQIQSA